MGQKEDIIRTNFRRLGLGQEFGSNLDSKPYLPPKLYSLGSTTITQTVFSDPAVFPTYSHRIENEYGVGIYIHDPVTFAGSYAQADDGGQKIHIVPGFNPIRFNRTIEINYAYPAWQAQGSATTPDSLFEVVNNSVSIIKEPLDILTARPAYWDKLGNLFSGATLANSFRIRLGTGNNADADWIINAPYFQTDQKKVTFIPNLMGSGNGYCYEIRQFDPQYTSEIDLTGLGLNPQETIGFISNVSAGAVSHRRESFSIEVDQGRLLALTAVYGSGSTTNILIDYGSNI